MITDSSALAWLKTSREQSPCFQRGWACISSFTFSIQHRPGKRIVTEDALSRRPNLEHTTLASDMLDLPTPEDSGLPDPTSTGPASCLAAPLIPPSYMRPPLDHDDILVSTSATSGTASRALPPASMPEGDLITCPSVQLAVPSVKNTEPAHLRSILRPQLALSEGVTPSPLLRTEPAVIPPQLPPGYCAPSTDVPVETVTFQELLDHAFFGPDEVAQPDPLHDHFPVRPCLRPGPVAADMPGGSCYCMTLVTDLPRRSARVAAAQPAPPSPPSPDLENEGASVDSEREDSAMNEDWFNPMLAPAPVSRPQQDVHVRAWLTLHPQHDRHVLA